MKKIAKSRWINRKVQGLRRLPLLAGRSAVLEMQLVCGWGL